MKAFVCVYQHPNPSPTNRALTAENAIGDRLLQTFLAQYDNPDCFYDWGDDPAFFSATHLLVSPAAASWGVCRPDVRNQLSRGDFVVWFCAKFGGGPVRSLSYYLIGCSTIAKTIERHDLWRKPRYAVYRRFYNTLARPVADHLMQHETIHPFHRDWEHRANSPYVLFDPSTSRSIIKLDRPLLVAKLRDGDCIESWRASGTPRVRQLKQLLFTVPGARCHLRTANGPQPHRQIALHRQLRHRKDVATQLQLMRDSLLEFMHADGR